MRPSGVRSFIIPESTIESSVAWYWWAAFLGGVVALLLIDLIFVHSKPHEVRTKEAAAWSAVWIALGLAFAVVVWVTLGPEAGQNYITGYLIEKSLSVDNLFVFVLIFKYFGVPNRYQHRVLFYGILGAFVFRGLFIWAGVALLNNFSWVAFLFGAFLLYTAYKLGTHEGVEVHPERNPVLRLIRRFVPMTTDFRGQEMIVREGGRLKATPLLAVLIVVETTDIVFAVDSIPAIFGVTRHPFIVFSSNAFALLGLRALYFLLADLVARFRYLDVGLSVILGVVGVKLIYEELLHMHDEGALTWLPEALVWHIPPWAPLILVAAILTAAVVGSVLHPDEALEEEDIEELDREG
ncbi:MAG: TerC family protein [Myxococcota bacterium]